MKRTQSGRARRVLRTVAVVLASLSSIPAVLAEIVTITPIKDNTLYEDPNGALSNGIGQYVFAGRAGISSGTLRRAVMAFDVAGNVPAGATIDQVTLTLHLSRAPFGASAETFELRRLLADWGEGTSDAALQEGSGAPSTPGDATWRHTFFDNQFWTSNGGDYSVASSAILSVPGSIGSYTWGPSAAMVADVQSWLDNPATNFGWILIGNEGPLQTARRFDSRENSQPAFRPQLTIDYTPGQAGGAGRVPDGAALPGVPLTVALEITGELTLRWGGSCQTGDDDYEVYEGAIGDFASHGLTTCSTAGAMAWTFVPSAGSSYYLVVPRNAAAEGSYGTDSSGAERPQASVACLTQTIATCE